MAEKVQKSVCAEHELLQKTSEQGMHQQLIPDLKRHKLLNSFNRYFNHKVMFDRSYRGMKTSDLISPLNFANSTVSLQDTMMDSLNLLGRKSMIRIEGSTSNALKISKVS